jgi:hypothetical protein
MRLSKSSFCRKEIQTDFIQTYKDFLILIPLSIFPSCLFAKQGGKGVNIFKDEDEAAI